VARRLTRHLVWTAPQVLSADARQAVATPATSACLVALATAQATPNQLTPSLDIFTAPRDRAIYLLHVGAEVEHALMVEYLYAAYSLGGPHLTDPAHQQLAQKWQASILQIAREEMAHLVTVENILTLIGGPLCFDREDYPIPQDLYPFPFELEPLTKKSLGKYVLAETPDDETLARLGLTEEIEAIKEYVGMGPDGTVVNRVGVIYAAILALFQPVNPEQFPSPLPPEFIASGDIQASSLQFQVNPAEWGLGYKDLLIETATDRPSAIAGLQAVALQGEGSTITNLEDSHFGKFLTIYREFPDENQGWQPAKNVATNPTTDQNAPDNQRISNDEARLWAGLSNLRYRMLLMYLCHSFRIEAPAQPAGRTPRGLLVSWAFGEMYNLRSITNILMQLPLNDTSPLLAGPPYEMPYSLELASQEADRWRMHRDLFMASQRYVQALLQIAPGQYDSYLNGLYSADQRALEQVLTLIGG
jgi:Ferritin-like